MEKERLEEILNEIGRTPLLSADEEAALCVLDVVPLPADGGMDIHIPLLVKETVGGSILSLVIIPLPSFRLSTAHHIL